MGIVIILIVAILLFGFLFKLLKFALIVAVVIGVAMFARNKLGGGGGTKRIK